MAPASRTGRAKTTAKSQQSEAMTVNEDVTTQALDAAAEANATSSATVTETESVKKTPAAKKAAEKKPRTASKSKSEGKRKADGKANDAKAETQAPEPVPPILDEDEKPAIAAVASADDSDFATGDYVVYPTHGVGRVIGVEAQQISDITLTLISIKFEKDRMTLRVPVEKAQNSGLRKLSTRKVLDDAIATLKGKSKVRRTMWSRRAQEYEAKINSGDPVSIAEVVRDLHRGADQPDQSYSERQMYQAALDRLAREFAAVDQTDETTAAQKLEEMLQAA